MKHKTILCILLALISAPFLGAQDYSRYAGLDSLLTQFYQLLIPEPVEVKNAEMDGLIEMCADSLARQYVTLQIFNHYRNARVMGEEAVAVHIYDEWIASGKVRTRSEFEQLEAEIFATFNRNSLIGMKAVPVRLKKPGGAQLTVPEEGVKSVLFFYDVSCAKCRLESALLPAVLDKVDFPLNFYAIYAGSDKKAWRKFRSRLDTGNKNVKVRHLWDPEMDSDYQLLYAVTGTPRMYFLLEDGEIIGRRLEVENLQQIINYVSIIQYGPQEK